MVTTGFANLSEGAKVTISQNYQTPTPDLAPQKQEGPQRGGERGGEKANAVTRSRDKGARKGGNRDGRRRESAAMSRTYDVEPVSAHR